MSEAVQNQTDVPVDDELHNLMKEYSIPYIAELGHNSLLSQSQYAKVIFHDIADTYPADADLCCRYSLTNGVTVSHGDRIALYRVGWSSVQEHIAFDLVPVTDATELQVLIKASSLPKDGDEFYQLCYVTINDVVCGASVPFQFCQLQENELCAVEEQDSMMVVRSRTSFTEEKLRQDEKGNLEEKVKMWDSKYSKIAAELQAILERLSNLETEKKTVEKKLEDNMCSVHQIEQLQQDLLASDEEKSQIVSKLNKAEQHIQVLTATVDTLSADKEHMAQLLRNKTENESGRAVKISQYRTQVDSLTHMLEALTQSKELVAQELAVARAANCELQEDIQNLEVARKVLQDDMLGVQKENKILQEEAASAKKISEEREKQINELQTEKEYLLSELVQAASKRIKEIKIMTEVYEGHMEELVNKVTLVKKDLCMVKAEADKRTKEAMDAAEMNKCLTQQLLEAQNKISEQEHSIAELTCEKERLATDLLKIVDSRSKLIRHNEHLANRLVDLEDESCPLKLQPQELSAELDEKTHFCKDFTDLEHRIANLEIAKEEVTADVNVQLERINAIAERLSELDTEEEKLHCEQQGVAAICDQQGNALIETVNELTSLEERLRKDYLMEGDAELRNNSEADNLKAAVNELAVYMESCRMRISEINQRRKEITEEKSVLMQQQSHALERKNECKKCEEQIYHELTALQEREREIVYEWGGPLTSLQAQLDHSLAAEKKLPLTGQDKAEPQQEFEETSSLQEQQCGSINATEMNVWQRKEQQLKLRLQMAAVEYRKLYAEKQKLEKRLAKLHHRLNEKSAKSSSSEESQASSCVVRGQPGTEEQAVVCGRSSTNDRVQERSDCNATSSCPICDLKFPPGAYNMFRLHFDAHLS